MSYSPFKKSIFDDIDINDLQRLVAEEVTEGYVIEFKREPPDDNQKIARSIASFANTNGGWLFFGVYEENRVAKNICGYDKGSFTQQDERVRSITSSRIDPVPVIHCRIINTNSKQAVLVVFIPKGEDTPYITSDGRIYRRHQDSSEPIAETDRHAIDRLVERGESSRKRFSELCEQDAYLNVALGQRMGWINIFIEPIPFGELYRPNVLSTKGIEDLIDLTNESLEIPFFGQDDMTTSMPFDYAQTTHESVILRQVRPEENELSLSLGLQLYVDGRARFHIPIQTIDDFIERLYSAPVESESRIGLAERISSNIDVSTDLRFFDFAIVWQLLVSFLFIYRKVFKGEDEPENVKAAMTIKNSCGYVPYLECVDWYEHVAKFGLPLITDNDVRVPSETGRGLLTDFSDMSWVNVSWNLCLSVGLPRKQLMKYIFSLVPGNEEALKELNNAIDSVEML